MVSKTKIDDRWEFELVVTDNKGTVCLDSRKWIYYDFIGNGELIVNRGIVKASKKVQLANGRALFQITQPSGVIKIEVEDGRVKYFKIDVAGNLEEIC